MFRKLNNLRKEIVKRFNRTPFIWDIALFVICMISYLMTKDPQLWVPAILIWLAFWYKHRKILFAKD